MYRIVLFVSLLIPFSVVAEDPNYNTATGIVSFPRVTVDGNETFLNAELLLNNDGTWTILSFEPKDFSDFIGSYDGTFSGGDTGTWRVEIDSNGIINGTAFFTIGGFSELSGNISDNLGNFIIASSGGSLVGKAALTGVISLSGEIDGTWVNIIAGTSGTFSGS